MKYFNLKILLLMCSVMTMQSLYAQLSIRGTGPDIVEVGEKFRVQFTVNTQNAPEPDWPSFAGFEVLYGPSSSMQSEVQVINGNVSSRSSITYTFVLTADRAGTFTIPSVGVESDGKIAHSRPITIRVVGNGTA